MQCEETNEYKTLNPERGSIKQIFKSPSITSKAIHIEAQGLLFKV